MKFRVERDVLADAVAWTARSLPARPAVPVLAGVLLTVEDGADGPQLFVAGFDYEVSTRVTVPVTSSNPGKALVSGRLLADITRSLPPHPVDVSLDGPRVVITCGTSRFTLPTMPVEDYPRLPELPATVGTIPATAFAAAVAQVAIAAGRDDTLPMLTGVRLEIDGAKLTMAATDRYRLAVREVGWTPANTEAEPVQVLIPARTLADVAKSMVGAGDITVSLSSGGAGEGLIGFSNGARRTTTRLLDSTFPPYRSLLPSDWTSAAVIEVSGFVDAVKRVALVADRGTPVRLEFAEGGVGLSVGAEDEGQAEEQLESQFEGESITTAFNPGFLIDGLNAVEASSARLLFTTPTKPAVIRPVAPADGSATAEYTYLIMPVRLPV